MKYKGSTCDFTQERNADLLRAYKQAVAVRDNISLSEIVQVLAKSPSKRFWVSVIRANEVVKALERGESISYMNPTRREMFLEIYRRYNIRRQQQPSLTKMQLLALVCNEPAPSFYLTPKSIVVILNKVRKEAKRKCLEQTKKRLRFMLGTL